jgi:hypothetical protein
MRHIMLLATVALLMTVMLAVLAGTAAAHPHVASNPDPDQPIAHGQLHPGFFVDPDTGLITSCEGVLEPEGGSGPAFFGLETAHHGPDAGTPGKGDGCYAAEDPDATPPPPDANPAIN